MHPKLFEVLGFPVYTYGVLLAAAYLLGLQLALMRARSRGLDPTGCWTSGSTIIISALVGAKLLLLIVEFDTSQEPRRAAVARALRRGVLRRADPRPSWWRFWYMRRYRMPMWTRDRRLRARHRARARRSAASGACSPAAASGGRRRCRGRSPSTVRPRPQNVGTPLDIPLHPTQLYEAAAELLILALLLATERKGRPFPGRTFWLYMLLYGISRFIIEIYRGDARGTVGMFSTSQFISLILVPLAIVMLIVLGRRADPSPAAAQRKARAARRPS